MANTFTLPEELFNSMINSFNEAEEKSNDVLLSTKEDKNKIKDDSVTKLTTKQKNRLKQVGNIFFSIDKVQTLFEKDFAKHIEKIKEYEITENVKQIVEFESEKIEVKKENKKRSWRSSVRKLRMMIRFYSFFQSVYENFKKFQEHAQEIIARNNGENDVTLREALTDKDARKKFIEKYKKMFHDIIITFFEDVIMGSVLPAVELVIRIMADTILELFRKFRLIIEKIGDAAFEIITSKPGMKLMSKFAGKRMLKIGAKIAARHAAASAAAAAPAATGIGAVVVPYTEAIFNAAMLAWDIYDGINLTIDCYNLYQDYKKYKQIAGEIIIGGLEKAKENVELARQKINAQLEKMNANLDKSVIKMQKITGQVRQ